MYIIWASVIPVVKIERFFLGLGLSKLYRNRDMFSHYLQKDLVEILLTESCLHT